MKREHRRSIGMEIGHGEHFFFFFICVHSRISDTSVCGINRRLSPVSKRKWSLWEPCQRENGTLLVECTMLTRQTSWHSCLVTVPFQMSYHGVQALILPPCFGMATSQRSICRNLRKVQNKSNMRSKKNQKLVLISNNDGDNNARPKRQNSSSYGSEDESNASQEFIGGMTPSLSPKSASALNLNGKSRASRGSATDPQSLYARKRRERINERLRILQSLVPNGTKVDISTMLEEAVQYVKFLQLQIKLLSSDDLWMYSPIAYNGMDIGLDLKITTPR